jgi:hypothetical protein
MRRSDERSALLFSYVELEAVDDHLSVEGSSASDQIARSVKDLQISRTTGVQRRIPLASFRTPTGSKGSQPLAP